MKLEVIASDELRKFGLPEFKTDGAAAIDLRALLNSPDTQFNGMNVSEFVYEGEETRVKSLIIHPGEQIKVDSGLKIHINSRSHVGLMFPRSSMGSKGLVLANGTGVIDSDYQGPLIMVLWNRSNAPITINDGDRVAQYMLTSAFQFDMKYVEQFSDSSERGEGGFGSTGAQ